MKDKFTSKISQWIPLMLIAFIGGLLGSLITFYTISARQESLNYRIKNLYEDEMATLVSPATIKKMIDDKDKTYILVDLRNKQEYDTEHITGAINIPAVFMNADQVVKAFQQLPKNKKVIVHCYSASCTLGREIGKLLAEHGIYVQEMDVGWNEWKYHWDLWNPGAGPLDGKNYIVTGASDPNAPIIPCTNGEFGC